jgi:hypothetical protein
VRLAHLILFGVIVGGLIVGSVLGRLGVAWGTWISLLAGLLARLTAAGIFALMAVAAAERGGAWYGLAAALAALALGTLGLVGLLAWGVLKYGIDLED